MTPRITESKIATQLRKLSAVHTSLHAMSSGDYRAADEQRVIILRQAKHELRVVMGTVASLLPDDAA